MVGVLDTTPPQVSILGPSRTGKSLTFTFIGSDDITPDEELVYASRLVPLEPTFSSFSSSTSRTFSNLANGDYTFYVKARDEEGNEDLSRQSFSVDESVLVANFMNGNTDFFKSRVYLWNPSVSAGNVSVRVFTLERTGLSTLLGTVDLGKLEAFSGRNIKLAEDILLPLEIPLPHTADGGNLTLEFTVGGSVRGAAQVFDNSLTLAFGTYPLQETLSTSSANPTVLVANFVNGNTDFFKSRIYLWNPATIAGNVTVRVFTLPLLGDTAKELTSGPFPLGSLGPESALNLKLAEDILTPAGIPTPHTTDSGNLTLEFTIQAAGVRGAAQVFDNSLTLALGTYPLQETPSTSSAGPTVLVANFVNGNTDFFTSRVYLWNPSNRAGDVTVRVFTLPQTGDPAEELTTAPHPLGTLEARSALDIRLVEDILIPLGISTPHIIDGGNLTLEFKIEAADVRGAAQVFSDSFGFGVYPLQQIPPTSTRGSPTVLIANFINGNTDFFKSRVYLWNPSVSAGNVSVQVFSLPLNTGVAQELTGPPRSLGTLGAKSALTVKLAEDILIPLGISTPHIIDGGNLTLEFKIEAADVRGAAQVFSDSFGFGTYPLEVISESSDSGAFEVLQDTVSIEEIAPGIFQIGGAVKNKDFQAAFSVDVAIAAFDSNGRLLYGDTRSISGTPRKQDGVVTNNVLLKDEIGYFSSIFEVDGTVQSAEFFVAAEGLATSPPLAIVQALSSTITFKVGAPFLIAPATVISTTEVSGIIRNNGLVTADLISMDIIFLDRQGRVLAVDSTIPDQSTLPPNTSSTFRGIGLIPRGQVASVVFSFDWLEE